MKKLISLLSIFAIVLSCSSDETSTPVAPPAPVAKYTITLSAGEGGTVSTTGGEYEAGQIVSVTAISQGEYVFTSWSDGYKYATRTITISSSITLTANFEKRKYPLTINFEGEGEVIEEIVNAGRTSEYDSGTTVKLTAQAAAEWVFIGWRGGVESTEKSIQITIGEPREVIATFEKKKYSLSVNIQGEGKVLEEVVDAGRKTDYNSGTTVKLTAQPYEGWEFVSWTGTIESTEKSVQILLGEQGEVTATFEKKKYAIKFSAEEGGAVSNVGGEYTYGSNLSIEAFPDEGYAFSHWSNDSEENPINISMIDEDQDIIAYFTNDLTIQDGFYKVYDAIGDEYGSATKYRLNLGRIIYIEIENNIIKTGFSKTPSENDWLQLRTLGFLCTECGKENMWGGYLGTMTDEIKKLSRNKVSWTHSKTYNNETSSGSIFASKTDEIDGKNFFFKKNGTPISRTEMHNIYKQEGKGFYSDSIYRNINFDKPYTILEAFVKDAARNGVNLSHALSQEFILSENNSIGSQPTATAYGACNDKKIHINYEDYYGDQMMFPYAWGDLLVFYHELGHDVLNLDHNCVSGGGMTDILSYGVACKSYSEPSETPVSVTFNNGEGLEHFKNIARRMFQGVDQLPLRCASGKINKIDDDFKLKPTNYY